MDETIRVLLVEDETIVSEAIQALLDLEEEITVVGEAETAAAAIQKALSLQPDVILLDLRLPDKPGVEVIQAIVKEDPEARILVLTAYASDEDVAAAFRAGAVGYVLKTQAIPELVCAIHDAYHGQSLLHPSIARKVLHQLSQPLAPPPTVLSAAELRVVVYLTRGFTNRDISTKISVSPATVRTHISRIMHKLHLTNRTQIALYALKQGLVELETPAERSIRMANGRNGVTQAKLH